MQFQTVFDVILLKNNIQNSVIQIMKIITDKKHHISKLHVEKLVYQIRTQTGIERFWYGFVQIDNSFPVSGPAIANYIPS